MSQQCVGLHPGIQKASSVRRLAETVNAPVASTNAAVAKSPTKAALDWDPRAAVELGLRHIRSQRGQPRRDRDGRRERLEPETEFGQRLLSDTPLGRFGQPRDIAPAVVFLA